MIAGLILSALGLTVPANVLSCNVPLIGTPARSATSSASASADLPNGLGILYTGAGMRAPFALRATMTLPRSNKNKGLFYTNWILLASRSSKSFVQIELMRWTRFHYRNEIALTWALADGTLQYRDTPVFVSDGPHTLQIAVTGDAIVLSADRNKVICTARLDDVYAPTEDLYYQIGNEVHDPGDGPIGNVWDIQAEDAEHRWQPVAPRCSYTAYGLSWKQSASGRYTAAGTFDRRAPAHFVDPCILEPW